MNGTGGGWKISITEIAGDSNKRGVRVCRKCIQFGGDIYICCIYARMYTAFVRLIEGKNTWHRKQPILYDEKHQIRPKTRYS